MREAQNRNRIIAETGDYPNNSFDPEGGNCDTLTSESLLRIGLASFLNLIPVIVLFGLFSLIVLQLGLSEVEDLNMSDPLVALFNTSFDTLTIYSTIAQGLIIIRPQRRFPRITVYGCEANDARGSPAGATKRRHNIPPEINCQYKKQNPTPTLTNSLSIDRGRR